MRTADHILAKQGRSTAAAYDDAAWNQATGSAFKAPGNRNRLVCVGACICVQGRLG
jgi:hypothetical protein